MMSQKLTFSLLLPVYLDARKLTHGDYYFARSLANALERKGHEVHIRAGENWEKTSPDDIALVIRGQRGPTQSYGRLLLEWCISFPPTLKTKDFEVVDHFFAASPYLARRIRRMVPAEKVSLMYQAFDAEVMFPDAIDETNDLIFVGTSRSDEGRPVVIFAGESSLPYRIWGGGWDRTPYQDMVVDEHVQNSGLGDVYRSGGVILNDHLVIMRRNQIISNRLYDGLACGRPVLSDAILGLPPELVPYVYEYTDAESFKEKAQLAISEPLERRQERIAFAHEMKSLHSFDQRADQLCDQVAKMLSNR